MLLTVFGLDTLVLMEYSSKRALAASGTHQGTEWVLIITSWGTGRATLEIHLSRDQTLYLDRKLIIWN